MSRTAQTAPTGDSWLTLSQAARLAPGSPSPNCIWRWCRRGVVARSGERVRLQHARLGGRLFTTLRWVREFGEKLAQADEAYFETPAPAPGQRRHDFDGRKPSPAQVRAELDAEGL